MPVERALVTHGHADHARGGHGTVWATPETLAIMAVRYGEEHDARPVAMGETVAVGPMTARFVPAGHVLGSAQIVMEQDGVTVVASGDYKRRRRPDLRSLFEPVPCDVFITEATFGLARLPPPAHARRDAQGGRHAGRQPRRAAFRSVPTAWARRSG